MSLRNRAQHTLTATSFDQGFTATFVCEAPFLSIGRDPACDFVLPRPSISKQHAQLIRTPLGYEIRDAGSKSGVFVNSERIELHRLVNGDRIIIGDIALDYEAPDEDAFGVDLSPVDAEDPGLIPAGEGATKMFSAAELAEAQKRQESKPPKRQPEEREATRQFSIEDLNKSQDAIKINPFVTKKSGGKKSVDEYTKLRAEIHDQLVTQIRLRGTATEQVADDELWQRARTVTNQIIYDMQQKGTIPEGVDPKILLRDVLNESLGLGPIQELLEDNEIEEIMVNGPTQIFIARRGKTVLTDYQFIDEERLLTIINRIVAPLGRPINQARPMVDARLGDGSRVNAIIAPVSLIGPVLTIRKFPAQPLQPEDLLAKGSFSRGMLEFLRLAVQSRQNIFIAGGTAAGKTTLLNVVSTFIADDERIITIEDSAELQMQQTHVISLETRPASNEGTVNIGIRELVKNALRMRPDRIIIGECRGGEAIDMLQAMNTGHDGSLSTGHSNSARDMLSRLETMCLMAGLELPLQAIREQVARAVDLVVFVERFPDGRRRIGEIIEVLGIEDNEYVVQDIYKFEYKLDHAGKLSGDFMPVGTIPEFLRVIKERGGEVPFEIFQAGSDSMP